LTLSLAALLILCRLFWLQPMRDAGPCMMPTVNPGDLFVVNRLAYLFADPARGDIVLVDAGELPLNEAPEHRHWFKRVVGLPGERIAIRPPHLIVDGSPLNDPPIFGTISRMEQGYRGFTPADGDRYPEACLAGADDKVVLGGGEYFLTGDNTLNSLDSRHFGAAPRSAIRGRVIHVFN
jgi:signal peptidase I